MFKVLPTASALLRSSTSQPQLGLMEMGVFMLQTGAAQMALPFAKSLSLRASSPRWPVARQWAAQMVLVVLHCFIMPTLLQSITLVLTSMLQSTAIISFAQLLSILR